MRQKDSKYIVTDLDCWLWLSLKKGMNASKIDRLIKLFKTPRNIYNMSKDELSQVKAFDKRTVLALADKSLQRVTDVKRRCKAHNINILTYDSPYYPDNLRRIDAPPYVLYTRSAQKINLNEYIRIAMVGNRRATEYGTAMAKKFAYELASNDVVIVSGMADGIDGASHRGAIDAGGITVAVLGCGPDRPYPYFHKELMQKIIETGMVISEYPPGDTPDRWHFPERNRIISGLSLGTLVVEAPKRSGSLITANYAIDQGRGLFAVPADITKVSSEGTNNLLKEYAIAVTSARDIFNYYSFDYSDIANIKKLRKEKGMAVETEYKETEKKKISKEEMYKDLTEDEKHIINKLGDTPVSFDEILSSTGIAADKLTSLITMLEIKGKIKTHPGKNFTLNT